MTKVPYSMMTGLGSAAEQNVGGAPSDVPQNSDLGSAAYLDAGVGASDLPQNSDLGSAAYLESGTGSGDLPTNADIATWDFVSSEIILGAGNQVYSAAHGLGALPAHYAAELVCKTAEHGFSVDERTPPESAIQSFGGQAQAGFSIVVNATHIALNQHNTLIVIDDDGTPAASSITPGNWRLILKAKK